MKSIIIKTTTPPHILKGALSNICRDAKLDCSFEYASFGYQKIDIHVNDEELAQRIFHLLMNKLGDMRIWVTVLNCHILEPASWSVGTGRWRYQKRGWIRYYFDPIDEGGMENWNNWIGGRFDKQGQDGQVVPFNNYLHRKENPKEIGWS